MEGKKAEIVGGKRVVRNNGGNKKNDEGEQQGAGMEGINDRLVGAYVGKGQRLLLAWLGHSNNTGG